MESRNLKYETKLRRKLSARERNLANFNYIGQCNNSEKADNTIQEKLAHNLLEFIVKLNSGYKILFIFYLLLSRFFLKERLEYCMSDKGIL